MEDEPQKSTPVPSPHPSSGLEKSSALLDLTPEKPKRRRPSRRPARLKQHDFQNSSDSTIKDCVTQDGQLAVPSPNTTVPLYHQLQQYKQNSNRNRSTGHKLEDAYLKAQQERVCGEKPLPQASTHTAAISNSSPVTAPSTEYGGSKEDGHPVHGGRYSDLVAVDVSEESFQRLTTCPRRARHTRGGRGKRESPATTPNIMDFFSEDFVVEDVSVDHVLPTPQPPELSLPSCDDALALYHFVNKI